MCQAVKALTSFPAQRISLGIVQADSSGHTSDYYSGRFHFEIRYNRAGTLYKYT
jgi:hypothetical protein